jgi:hypothetical protein
MKTLPLQATTRARRHTQNGSTVLVVIALLAIVLAYLSFNLRALERLRREIKLVERHQIQRLQSTSGSQTPARTNAAPASATWTFSPSYANR